MDGSEVRGKWLGDRSGEHYSGERWSSARRRQRDPDIVGALLGRHLGRVRGLRLLDAPCGTGRLRESIAAHGAYVGLDASPSMLAVARHSAAENEGILAGDLARLPFGDSLFDAVVCCRLLHHLAQPRALEEVLAELVRVSRNLVIASFWDSGSLPAWRRALFPGGRAPRRFSRSRAELSRAVLRVGAEVVGWKPSLRFVSRQTFFVAIKCTRA